MSSPSPIIEEVSWWRRVRTAPAVFTTALPRDEVVRRLRAAVGSGWLTDPTKPIVGRVSNNGAFLRRQTKVRNNLTTMVALKFQDQGGGTRINANFGVGAIMFIIMMVWSLIVVGIAVGVVMAQTQLPANDVAFLPLILVPIAFIVAAVMLTITVRRQGPVNRQVLSDFLRATLDATEVKDAI